MSHIFYLKDLGGTDYTVFQEISNVYFVLTISYETLVKEYNEEYNALIILCF